MRATLRVTLLGVLLAFALGRLAEAAPVRDIYPLSKVRAGQRAVGKSIFKGTYIQSFDVEIIGVLHRYEGTRSLILGKVLNGPVVTRKSGIIAGMSGSPVYINGKLIGAIALIPFVIKIFLGMISDNFNLFGLGFRKPYIIIGLLVQCACLLVVPSINPGKNFWLFALLAFILMMARLNNCVTCNSDSYRAMHGCITCARQSIKRFHGSDEDLTRIFETARTEVIEFLQKKNETNTPPSGFKKSSKGSYVPKNIY